MSEYLPGFDLPGYRTGTMPANGAYQCPVCQGIAYNPVCPYCEDDLVADGIVESWSDDTEPAEPPA